MKFLLNQPEPATETVTVTLHVGDDGDLDLRYDGINVAWIFAAGGKIVTRYVLTEAREQLEAKGVAFTEFGEITTND